MPCALWHAWSVGQCREVTSMGSAWSSMVSDGVYFQGSCVCQYTCICVCALCMCVHICLCLCACSVWLRIVFVFNSPVLDLLLQFNKFGFIESQIQFLYYKHKLLHYIGVLTGIYNSANTSRKLGLLHCLKSILLIKNNLISYMQAL